MGKLAGKMWKRACHDHKNACIHKKKRWPDTKTSVELANN